MDAELVELATSGATTLVGLMVTEAWGQARGRFAALFGHARAEDTAAELEIVRGEVLAGGAPEEAASEWAPRLRRLLADPDTAAELRSLLAEFAPKATAPGSSPVTINGGNFHGTVVATGSVRDLTINPGS
ncbi:hypothetical protein [Kitasatospora sp. MAP5-34]|uniref:hypothetical protein n=1 Tax=Kitasatospora sp. MAP5-34 TaxID=3035102 RepID=UPI002473D81D|nr:hypothetical protein [Kitasatospora sp. MAP5-34]MDH6575804.1 hypothetical protein [Kitasatospora sp. MAP5-34]